MFSICEYLIGKGHNTELFNPFLYPIKKLYKIYARSLKLDSINIIEQATSNHLSRISVAACKSNIFSDYIDKISKE